MEYTTERNDMATAKRTASGSWSVRVYVGRENGKDLYKRFTGDNKREVERMASTYLAVQDHDDLTFGDAAEQYIRDKEAVLSPNTIRTYKICNARLGLLHTVKISKVDSQRVQRVISRISEDLAPKTVRSTYGFITAVLKMYSPGTVLQVTLPEPEHKTVLIPTDEEVNIMINSAKHPDLALAIQLAAFGSLRSGECCALSRDMVFHNQIKVTRTFVLDDTQTWIIKNSPKTAAGFRDVPLPRPLMASIRASVKEDGRIIHYTPASLHDAFRRLTKSLGFPPYKFHSLRHYFATSMHAQGIPDKVICQIGGWEDVGTLQRIYQHATSDKIEEAGNIINMLYYKTMTKSMTSKISEA